MSSKKENTWWIYLILIFVLYFSVYYYQRDTSFYLFGDESELSKIRLRFKWWIIAHFGFAAFTLFIGPLQFIPLIRNKFPGFHRFAGRFYIIGSIVSALTVYVLLATTYTLPGAIPSLGLLAAIWLYTTIAAFIFIRKHNIIRHKEYMLRSYVCGLAFMFIRLLPEINDVIGIFNFIENDTMRRTVYEWICWVYPLVMLEFWLVWRKQLIKA
ncbi:MAG: DUF2306 domain-containing protein [Reichenbachiella sp.]|uniref:DUF2306 domain-containing protein n=1 Tax=Reichenbachiella sp. TaxID=2184521 RepID=UPI00329A68AC